MKWGLLIALGGYLWATFPTVNNFHRRYFRSEDTSLSSLSLAHVSFLLKIN